MNLTRHVDAHHGLFPDLVKGDGDSAQRHREFYDEYLSVMDFSEEFYIQTLRDVFQEYSLPRGELVHRDVRVDPGAITNHRAADGRGRARRHFRHRPDPSRARSLRQYPRSACARITSSLASAITACSTAGASRPKSTRACAASCARSNRRRRAQSRKATESGGRVGCAFRLDYPRLRTAM